MKPTAARTDSRLELKAWEIAERVQQWDARFSDKTFIEKLPGDLTFTAEELARAYDSTFRGRSRGSSHPDSSFHGLLNILTLGRGQL